MRRQKRKPRKMGGGCGIVKKRATFFQIRTTHSTDHEYNHIVHPRFPPNTSPASIPAETVLRHDGRRDALVADAAALLAAVVAVAAGRAAVLGGRGPAGAGHEVAVAAHGAVGARAHLGRAGAGEAAGHRARADVAAALLAVAARHIDHGGRVHGRTGHGADADADGGALDGGRGAGVAADGRTVAGSRGGRGGRVVGRCWRVVVDERAGENGNGRVDGQHHRVNGHVGVGVGQRVWRVKIQLQLVDHARRDVGLRQGGDVPERRPGIIWQERVHGNLIDRDRQGIGDTLGQEGEDLKSRVRGLNDEWVVETVVEADLDQSGVLRRSWHATSWLHQSWQARGQSTGSRCARS